MTLLLIIGLVVCVIGFIVYRKPDPLDTTPGPWEYKPPSVLERRRMRRQWEDRWFNQLNK